MTGIAPSPEAEIIGIELISAQMLRIAFVCLRLVRDRDLVG
jgi:hypothetical protein